MEIDKSNMRQVIIDSPRQLQEGLTLAEAIKVTGNFKNVVICAMGGSALPADIINSLGIQLHIHRDYDLPNIANNDSLVICISYSGNTEETVSAFKKAIDKKLRVIGIASGGEIEQLCQKNNITFVKIPGGIQPRSATGYIFSSLVQVLENSGLAKNLSLEMPELVKQLENVNASLEKEGKNLAKKITGKIPIVYSSDTFGSIARIWKIKFNENAKIPSFYNVFPELNHNEMVGYTDARKDFFVIMLRDASAHQRTQKRMELTAKMLAAKNIDIEIINLKEESVLLKIFSCLLLGDWTSYYVALENNIDPTPVKIVEEFKKLMQE